MTTCLFYDAWTRAFALRCTLDRTCDQCTVVLQTVKLDITLELTASTSSKNQAVHQTPS